MADKQKNEKIKSKASWIKVLQGMRGQSGGGCGGGNCDDALIERMAEQMAQVSAQVEEELDCGCGQISQQVSNQGQTSRSCCG